MGLLRIDWLQRSYVWVSNSDSQMVEESLSQVRLTRGELAEIIGCRAETTTRLMTKWRRSNIVESKREGITINDLEELRQIASGNQSS